MKWPYDSCGGGNGRKGPVGIGCIFEFHIPDLRYMVYFFFLETDILKSHNDLFEK